MNRVCGAAGGDTLAVVRRVAAWLERQGQRALRRQVETQTLCLGYSGDSLVGAARKGPLDLVYLGTFFNMGFSGGIDPQDDPNATALHLLERYETAGTAFLTGLWGSFVVALADRRDDSLWLACDPQGNRRLFLNIDGGSIRFSTQLVDFAGLTEPHLPLDRSLEDFLLGYEFLPDHRTPVEGVRALPAGVLLEWRPTAGATEHEMRPAEVWPEWTRDLDLHDKDEATVVAVLRRAFRTALEEQLPSAPDVGVMLGGFDSALIAAALTEMGKRVQTFSFGYADQRYNQPFADELASTLGIRHHWVTIDQDVVRRGLEGYALVFNQPLCLPHYVIATARVAEAMRAAGLRHGFTGDGCDGLFFGYPTVYARAVLVQTLSKAAPLIVPLASPLTRMRPLERRIGHPYRLARNVVRVLRRRMPARGHIASCILDEASLGMLRTDEPPRQIETAEEILERLARGLESLSPVRLAYLGKGAVGLNKTKLEGSSASSGVSLSSPFLHPGMARVAKMLPERLLRPTEKTKSEATGKYVLMRMAEEDRLIPDYMIYQRKRSPVTSPVDAWYMGPLRSFMLAQLEGLPFAYDHAYAADLLRPKIAEELFRKHVGISRFALHAPCLLATYASLTRHARMPPDPETTRR
ncbi:MAG: asparagine synthase-related protein [Vicinamibacteraceae bacterium]